MQYFDFNLPYLEDPSTGKTTPAERAARKKTRLKLVVKAVELGYSGIAYNRSIKGVISESDRCSISHFPLSSLLSLSPSLSSSAAFHRRLLSGTHAAGSPFRQYTRLTVAVDNPSQSSAFNSGNAILKTYDLVAVRPMNQVAFDQACQFSEVDLIAIDFSDKVPFRLKIPMVKAAIARGVYFEITYSGLIEDIHVRRKLIANAKPLVDWTRGKNLIVSSAAASVLEFRGPNDVANLLSLLGLASEHAKAAISKNCRSLIAKTLKKKQFYKEAIRVDMMPSSMKSDPKKPWIVDSMEWDPISSGEGDLLLEDLAKSFSEAGKGSETAKPNGVVSIENNIASHDSKATSLGADIMEFDDANNSTVAANGLKTSSETEKLRVCSQRKPMSLFSIPQDHNSDTFNTSLEPFLDSMNTITSSIASESQLKGSDVLDKASDPVVMQDAQNSVFSQNSNISNADSILQKCEAGIEKQTDSEVSAECNNLIDVSESTHSMIVDDINANLNNVTEPNPLVELDLKDRSDRSLFSSDCLVEEALEVKELKETNEEVSLHADKSADLELGDEGKEDYNLLNRVPSEKDSVPVEEHMHKELECCKQETNIYLSTNSHGISHEDPSEMLSSSSELLIHDSMIHGEDMELEVQGETPALHITKTTTKSVKQRPQQRRYLRFPFKNLLQVPFKRKNVAPRYKIKKR